MSRFIAELERRNPSPEDRRWIFVPYDQLSDRIGPLASEEPGSLGLVLVESSWKAARRPYHRQKLALVLANLRHFALEQAERGVAVRYVTAETPYAEALRPLAEELGGLTLMEPAERELRVDLEPLAEEGLLRIVPHEGWLTTSEQFEKSSGGPPWRMDSFYRSVRRDSGILMKKGKPLGGKFSFDAENREPWRGEPEPPAPPRFEPDEITVEVGELVASRFDRHPGRLDLESLPATRDDARALWAWALGSCMEHFGPYEDAMSRKSRGLFHTRISALLNLHRLLPAEVVAEVERSDAPLQSREGFIRQILGWREFVRHVHRATDGFRDIEGESQPGAHTPGDGGWGRWRGEKWAEPEQRPGPSGGAEPSVLDADWPLPAAFWGERSGLDCLDSIVHDVWDEAYSHHIPRLMVLANLATLLGVRPREITDWFWVAYADAYDWVVEPNVLGMGTFAVGGLFTTKPYVSGAAYIHRMGDYCASCRFDPKSNCPITRLYWAFLDRNRERLAESARMGLMLKNLERRAEEERERDRDVFARVRERLSSGEELEADEEG